MRVITQIARPGSTITIHLQADTRGDESIYGFSLNYNTSLLTYVPNSIAIGSGAGRQAGGTCDVSSNTTTPGQFGFSIDCNNSTIAAGSNRELLTLKFTIVGNAADGNTPIAFGDAPARRSVSSNPAAGPITSLPTTFTDGAVNIASRRNVHVDSQNTPEGNRITVVLSADTMGDESVFGFSLNYSNTSLTFVPGSVMIGSGATKQSGGMCTVSSNTTTAGQFGFTVDCGNSTITAGADRPLVTLQFDVISPAPVSSTPLTFGDTPTTRSVTSNTTSLAAATLPATFTNGAVNINTTRTIRVLSQDSSRGSVITVVMEADAMGDESIYGYSINYNPNILAYVPNSVMIGSGATNTSGGMCDVLPNTNTAGQFGFSIDCGSKNLAAGNNRRLVTLQFTIAADAPFGMTPIQFGDAPARRSVASCPCDGAVQSRPTVFTDGFVNIVAPTAAAISMSGRVLTITGRGLTNAVVELKDSNGGVRQVRTSAFGYFRFEGIPSGESYIISVLSKRYQFDSRLINALDDLTGLEIIERSPIEFQKRE